MSKKITMGIEAPSGQEPKVGDVMWIPTRYEGEAGGLKRAIVRKTTPMTVNSATGRSLAWKIVGEPVTDEQERAYREANPLPDLPRNYDPLG